MSETLTTITPGLPAISTMAKTTTPFPEPLTAELLAEQSKYPLFRQLASTVRAPGVDYFYNRNGFLTCVAPIDRTVQKIVPRSIQAHFLKAYHYARLARHLKNAACITPYGAW